MESSRFSPTRPAATGARSGDAAGAPTGDGCDERRFALAREDNVDA